MSKVDSISKKKAALLEKLAALKKEESALAAAEKEKIRKEESRVKLLLGAGLITAAKNNSGEIFEHPIMVTGQSMLHIATLYLTDKDRNFVLGSKTWERLGQR